MPPLKLPDNAKPYLGFLKDETREKYTNGFFHVYLGELIRKDGIPHPLLSPSPQHHYGPELQTRDLCIVLSAHGTEQRAEMIPVWIHESKAGKELVKRTSSPTGNVAQDMLKWQSRRTRIGNQLLDRFRTLGMFDQMKKYQWTELWASSAAGDRCTIWRVNVRKRAVYRLVSWVAGKPKQQLLKKLDDPNPIQFPAALWNINIITGHQTLANFLGYGQGKIMAGVEELKELDDAEMEGLNVRLPNPVPVAEEDEDMDADEPDDDDSEKDPTVTTPSSSSSEDPVIFVPRALGGRNQSLRSCV
ncbi:uncharacterized protein LOC129602140 [Paramacrobiotus metropolitanus]|uniref:uncharacterized protein LOC129602140 n=1 Tax=Paramacrobiotus metropolitanus TaxID=2943436 RepID=UPI0024457497|nr:uncharacterized protein LOC129602140 [Paramacrobiotus metropolitanus]